MHEHESANQFRFGKHNPHVLHILECLCDPNLTIKQIAITTHSSMPMVCSTWKRYQRRYYLPPRSRKEKGGNKRSENGKLGERTKRGLAYLAAGYTQAQVAVITGVSRQRVQQWVYYRKALIEAMRWETLDGIEATAIGYAMAIPSTYT